MSDCDQNCINWVLIGQHVRPGAVHHPDCKNRHAKPRLFYLEAAVDAWIPAPDNLENMISLENYFDFDGEKIEIEFKRVDLSDCEYAALPDCDGPQLVEDSNDDS